MINSEAEYNQMLSDNNEYQYNNQREMTQGSIEWLASQIMDNWNDITAGARDIAEFIDKAKAMHKNEIIKAFIYGDASDCLSEDDSIPYAEEYYDKTFNTKEK